MSSRIRSEWVNHPNWPQQVLLVRSHDNFRRVSSQCIEHARSEPSFKFLELRYRLWIGAMRSHERYEEVKLYPYLAKRFALSFDEAEAGHEALHEAHDDVLGAFRAITERAAESILDHDREALVAALRHHDRVLGEHLDLEEELVVPPLLGMDPSEFQRLLSSSIHQLLRALESEATAAANR